MVDLFSFFQFFESQQVNQSGPRGNWLSKYVRTYTDDSYVGTIGRQNYETFSFLIGIVLFFGFNNIQDFFLFFLSFLGFRISLTTRLKQVLLWCNAGGEKLETRRDETRPKQRQSKGFIMI